MANTKFSQFTTSTSILGADYLVGIFSSDNGKITFDNFKTLLSYQPLNGVLSTLASTTPSTVGLNVLQVATPVGANYLKISNLGTPIFLTASGVLSDIGAQPVSANLTELAGVNPSLPGKNIMRLDAPTVSGYVQVNAGIDSDAFIRTPAQVVTDIGAMPLTYLVASAALFATRMDDSHVPSTLAMQDYVKAVTGSGVKDVSDDTIASAATLNLDSTVGPQVDVLGTTPPTAITLTEGDQKIIRFKGIMTIAQTANVLTPSGAPITTAVNSFATVTGQSGGVALITSYFEATGGGTIADIIGGTIDSVQITNSNIQTEAGGALILVSATDTGSGSTRIKSASTNNAPRILLLNVNNSSRTVSISGDVALAGSLTTVGSFATTITATAASNPTLPAGTGLLSREVGNYSTGAQTPAAATRTYITGSAITIPDSKIKIGTKFSWKFNITKTAAGTAASTYDVCIGTLGTTGDSAILSFTKPAGTAAADEGFVTIEAVVRGPLSASGILVGEFVMYHNLASTGHATVPVVCVNTVSSAFDVTTAGLIAGVCVTSGASDALTVQQVSAQAFNL